MLRSWAMFIFLSLFAAIVFVGIIDKPGSSTFGYLFLIPIVLLGLLTLKMAITGTLTYLKFGRSMLLLNQTPLIPGSEVIVALIINEIIEPGKSMDFNFFLEKRKTTVTKFRNKSQKSTIATRSNSTTKTVLIEPEFFQKGKIVVPVSFELPEDAQVDVKYANPVYEWKIEAKASLGKLEYFAEFPLPVFAVSDPGLIEKRKAYPNFLSAQN
eukprot:Anaeramoba_ignava/c9929_g1_i1.p1 GENE.c9929_g1_i1~~c9929_g1_i1.p1  ORF type:complete len:212 (-),score=12.24 c9929_g1_i1:19-654(-)